MDASGVEPVHAQVMFDGLTLMVASFDRSSPVVLSGRRLGRQWTPMVPPCTLDFGAARIAVRAAEDHPRDSMPFDDPATVVAPPSFAYLQQPPTVKVTPTGIVGGSDVAASPQDPIATVVDSEPEPVQRLASDEPRVNLRSAIPTDPQKFSAHASRSFLTGELTQVEAPGDLPAVPSQPPAAPAFPTGFIAAPVDAVPAAPRSLSEPVFAGRAESLPSLRLSHPVLPTTPRSIIDRLTVWWAQASLPLRIAIALIPPALVVATFTMLSARQSNDEDRPVSTPSAASAVASSPPPKPAPPPSPQTITTATTPNPPSPPPKTSGSKLTPARSAVDALAAGNYPVALSQYSALAAAAPQDEAYKEAVRILRSRVQ